MARRENPRKRGENGSAQKGRLILMPAEMDAALIVAAEKRGLTVAMWIRQVLARALKRAA
jgi:hypothetical protein